VNERKEKDITTRPTLKGKKANAGKIYHRKGYPELFPVKWRRSSGPLKGKATVLLQKRNPSFRSMSLKKGGQNFQQKGKGGDRKGLI